MRKLTTLVLGLALALSGLVFASSANAAPSGSPSAAVGPFNVIYNQYSNKCLAPKSNSYNANALVVQTGSCGLPSTSHWSLQDIGGGYYFIVNRATGFCLDLQANSEEEVQIGTKVQQFWCNIGYTSEHWRLVPSNVSGYYRLQTKIKGLCADIQNRSTANNAQLQVIECKPYEPAQRFRFSQV